MAIKHWGLSGIAILVPLVIFYIPYLGVSGLHNITRSAADAEFYSAHYYDYFVAPETHWLLGDFSVNLFEDKGGKARVEHTLFFGVITLVVAGFGVVTFKKSKDNRTKVIYALVFLLSIGLAFGPVLNLNGVEIQMPYKFLQENIILLQAIRVPTRISVISLLAISVLVGFWMQKRSRLSVLWLVIILIGLEQLSWPLKLSQPAIANQDLYNIIEQQIPENSALLNFPVGKSNLQYMRQNIRHTADRQVPSINGYSGIFPSGYRDILNLLSTKEFFQSPRTGLGVLADLGVDYFVYHNEFCIAEFDQLRCETLHAQLHALVDAKVIQLVGEAGKDFVYDISVLKSDTSIQTITDISATTIPESNVIKITHKNSTEQLWVQSHFDDYPHSELLTYQLQIKYMNKGVVVRTQDHKIYQPLFLLPNQEKTTEFHYKPPVWVGYESIELNISMKNN